LQQQDAPRIDERLTKLIGQVDVKRIERTVRDLVRFGTRHSMSATDDDQRGTGAARSYLVARLEAAAKRSSGRMTVERKSYKMPVGRGGEVEIVNVVATIKGTKTPDRVYVVGGHYDSRNRNRRDSTRDAPGANDDGSGTAAVVELAHVLAEIPLASTVRLVCYDGEELGLVGSRKDAEELESAEVAVDGMMTLDIVGNTESQDGRRERGYVRVFSYLQGNADSPGRSLARVVSDCAARYVEGLRGKLIFRGDRFGRGGDHRPFAEAGYASVRLTEPFENFSRQHQDVTERDGKPYGDLPDYMDFPYLANVTRLTLAVVYELASAPPAPTRVRVRTTPTLGTSVTVQMRDVPDDLIGYEIMVRETTAPDWQRAVFVPAIGQSARQVDKVLEGVLLDDSVIGARSVGRSGVRSRVTAAAEAPLTRASSRRRR